MKKLTTDEFIKKSREVHGDKYDYSKANYLNSHTKICIICPKHGKFWKEASSHLKGQGCPKCSYENVSLNMMSSTDEFIKKAKKIHGDKYDYSKVEYINNHTKICIICPKHGKFWQQPNNHLSGSGCYKCATEKVGDMRRMPLEEFISKAIKIHGDKYDYSKVEYVTAKEKVCIICPEHGEFWQKPIDHLRGCECQKCSQVNGSLKQRSNTKKFIEKARKIHGDKYDYSMVRYITAKEKVCIICPEHGEFWQEASSHIKGCGCPVCKESKLEKITRETLNDLNIEFIEHCNKRVLQWLENQHLDFYLPKLNIGIECQGIQHYKCDSFFGKNGKFELIKKRDKKKKILCEENNVKLIYIPYNMSNEQILKKLQRLKK